MYNKQFFDFNIFSKVFDILRFLLYSGSVRPLHNSHIFQEQ